MKIVIAPDSFKGSMEAIEVANVMRKGVESFDPSIETAMLPIADGGEGTTMSLVNATNGKVYTVDVSDPLGRKTNAIYGVLGDGKTAVIEVAEASGLLKLNENERNPLFTTSFGTGELIIAALNQGIRKFVIGLGGSATNDGGVGILEALGAKLLDKEGIQLPRGGSALINLHQIDTTNIDKRISKSDFLIASDVSNPLVGQNGASFVFGGQKGASLEQMTRLDNSLKRFADVVQAKTSIQIHDKKGAGAAGGIGGMLQAFFPATMSRGIDVVLSTISFKQHLVDADLVITGEGKSDRQTLHGKAPFGIAQFAKAAGIPVILLSGTIQQKDRSSLQPYFDELHALVDGTVTAEASMKDGAHYLQKKTEEVMRNYMNKPTV